MGLSGRRPWTVQLQETQVFMFPWTLLGKVREVVPVSTANERTNESVCRQLMKWKFKPISKDGMPAQAESLLTFTLNTRAFGPTTPLSDIEVRKLASNTVEPVISPGTFPAGTTYTLRAAIDSDGRLIEVIAGNGPPKLYGPCYQAVSKWQFEKLDSRKRRANALQG